MYLSFVLLAHLLWKLCFLVVRPREDVPHVPRSNHRRPPVERREHESLPSVVLRRTSSWCLEKIQSCSTISTAGPAGKETVFPDCVLVGLWLCFNVIYVLCGLGCSVWILGHVETLPKLCEGLNTSTVDLKITSSSFLLIFVVVYTGLIS